jgi:undecaprenyl-diphosphatase
MSEQLIALILGLVEGLTEFLPVSSTGHLILFGHALEFTGEKAEAFEVMIQGGAILSVLLLYWRRFIRFAVVPRNADLKSALKAPGLDGVTGWLKLAVVTFPPCVVGLLAHDYITEHLFSPVPVALGLIVGAFALIFAENKTHGSGATVEQLTFRQSLIVGLFQCIALWPGMSRAGWTIVGGMVSGLSRGAAAEFSFIAAVPVILLASGYSLLKHLHAFSPADLQILLIGFVVSFLTAALAITAFMKVLQKISLKPFAYYRIILGLVVFCMLFSRG